MLSFVTTDFDPLHACLQFTTENRQNYLTTPTYISSALVEYCYSCTSSTAGLSSFT